MPLRALEGPGLKAEYRGYKKLELLANSGAAASAMPEKLLVDCPVLQGEASRRGVHYLTVGG